jgi:hypothetical protein
MHTTSPNAADNDAARIDPLRQQVLALGGIMGISDRFCPAGSYWSDIVLPGYSTYATAATPLAAATAAMANLNRHPVNRHHAPRAQ